MPQQQPSTSQARLGGGCMALFGLPFAAIGLFVMRMAWLEYQKHGTSGDNWFVLPLFGAVFAVVGIGVMCAGFVAMRGSKAVAEAQMRNPGQPWMWKREWATGAIPSNTGQGVIGLWIFALFWSAIAFPIAFVFFHTEKAKEGFLVLVVLLFPLIGVLLLVGAIYGTLRQLKFGGSVCRIDRMPVEPGRHMTGVIETRLRDVPESGVLLILSCVNRITTGTGKNRSTRETTMWRDEQTAGPGMIVPGSDGARISFDFEIPPDAHSTDESDGSNVVMWRLDASAELFGVDYEAQFELPVFATSAIPPSRAQIAEYHLAHRKLALGRELSPRSKVEVSALPTGGTQFVITARKEGGLGTFVFLLIWFGAVYAMIHFEIPFIFPLIFGGIGLLILMALIDQWIGVSTLQVDRAGINVRRSWFGNGGTRFVEAEQIESIDTKVVASQGKNAFYAVIINRRDGTPLTAAQYVRSRDDAETLAAKLADAMKL